MTREQPIYASNTQVTVDKSRGSIQEMLKKAKAVRILTMDEPDHALIMCMLGERLLRFKILLKPKVSEQERRSRWRALHLVIKAKLESVAAGIETEEQAFLAATVMPDGRTVSEFIEPEIVKAIKTGKMPAGPLLIEGPK